MKHPASTPPLAAALEAELDALTAQDRRRACPEMAGASRTKPDTADGPVLAFCSNDYLGLAAHPALAAAAATAAAAEGFGASASRLVAGDLPALRALEARLASFLGRPSALVFPTGYQANLGVLAALAGPEDLIVSDALNHASLIDGCRLSRAKVAVYPHADAQAAAQILATATGFRRRLLVTESLFSMDGDAAPLAALAATAAQSAAVLVVDEAHAVGACGPDGRGLCAAAGVVPDVLIGTLGKALGAAGGFVAGDAVLREYLVNRARTFIFTTALPPPVAAAATAALGIVAGTDGEQRRAALERNRASLAAGLIAAGLIAAPPPGPIFPVILGSETRALAVAAALRARGVFVPAIRPPTVPADTARLRITVSAAHAAADVTRLIAALAETTR